MKDSIYLVCNRRGVLRMTKKPPGRSTGEIAVNLVITIPESNFNNDIPKVELRLHPVEREPVEAEAEVIPI